MWGYDYGIIDEVLASKITLTVTLPLPLPLTLTLTLPLTLTRRRISSIGWAACKRSCSPTRLSTDPQTEDLPP